MNLTERLTNAYNANKGVSDTDGILRCQEAHAINVETGKGVFRSYDIDVEITTEQFTQLFYNQTGYSDHGFDSWPIPHETLHGVTPDLEGTIAGECLIGIGEQVFYGCDFRNLTLAGDFAGHTKMIPNFNTANFLATRRLKDFNDDKRKSNPDHEDVKVSREDRIRAYVDFRRKQLLFRAAFNGRAPYQLHRAEFAATPMSFYGVEITDTRKGQLAVRDIAGEEFENLLADLRARHNPALSFDLFNKHMTDEIPGEDMVKELMDPPPPQFRTTTPAAG